MTQQDVNSDALSQLSYELAAHLLRLRDNMGNTTPTESSTVAPCRSPQTMSTGTPPPEGTPQLPSDDLLRATPDKEREQSPPIKSVLASVLEYIKVTKECLNYTVCTFSNT